MLLEDLLITHRTVCCYIERKHMGDSQGVTMHLEMYMQRLVV